jgi:hypothetical protein
VQGKKLGLVLVGMQLREFGVASFKSFDEELSVVMYCIATSTALGIREDNSIASMAAMVMG